MLAWADTPEKWNRDYASVASSEGGISSSDAIPNRNGRGMGNATCPH